MKDNRNDYQIVKLTIKFQKSKNKMTIRGKKRIKVIITENKINNTK